MEILTFNYRLKNYLKQTIISTIIILFVGILFENYYIFLIPFIYNFILNKSFSFNKSNIIIAFSSAIISALLSIIFILNYEDECNQGCCCEAKHEFISTDIYISLIILLTSLVIWETSFQIRNRNSLKNI